MIIIERYRRVAGLCEYFTNLPIAKGHIELSVSIIRISLR